MKTYLRFLPTVTAVMAAISPLVAPSVGQVMAENPDATAAILGSLAALSHLLPSPLKK